MEKRTSLIFIILLLATNLFSQHLDFQKNIRIPIWAELDAYPELKEAQDTNAGIFDYPLSRLKTVAPFLITGMTYGFSFSYTPSDKLRNVSEFLEVIPLQELTEKDGNIIYSTPWIENNKLNCWIDFTRTPQMQWTYKMWNTIKINKIKGRGKGKISDGFDGIQNATNDCIKNAIRSHYQQIIKNKPKEICGKVIIRNTPSIAINAGHYIVELDFFLETDKIVKYTQF